MSSLFEQCVDSILDVFGSTAAVEIDGTEIAVQASPVFPSKLSSESKGVVFQNAENGNILIKYRQALANLKSMESKITIHEKTCRIQTISRISSEHGETIALELTITR